MPVYGRKEKSTFFYFPSCAGVKNLIQFAPLTRIRRSNNGKHGEPNVAGAINEIASRELRRRYRDLTADEYLWCAEQQRKNEESRNAKRGK